MTELPERKDFDDGAVAAWLESWSAVDLGLQPVRDIVLHMTGRCRQWSFTAQHADFRRTDTYTDEDEMPSPDVRDLLLETFDDTFTDAAAIVIAAGGYAAQRQSERGVEARQDWQQLFAAVAELAFDVETGAQHYAFSADDAPRFATISQEIRAHMNWLANHHWRTSRDLAPRDDDDQDDQPVIQKVYTADASVLLDSELDRWLRETQGWSRGRG
jgi:hypothetical protein